MKVSGSSSTTSGSAVDEANQNADEFTGLLSDPEFSGSSDLMFFLELQMAVQKEQQAYMALSNMMKARSDGDKNSINNFK